MSSLLSYRRCFATAVALLCTAALSAQTRFLDDAQWTVELRAQVERVFAAGAAAEVLLYPLTPDNRLRQLVTGQ